MKLNCYADAGTQPLCYDKLECITNLFVPTALMFGMYTICKF